MTPLEIVLILLAAVVVSGACARLSPIPLPLPLVQIAIGVLIAAVADLGVRLDPNVFFVLFMPQLLFFDGWRTPKEGLLRDKGTILALALGLVFFTVAGIGLFIHWMIPVMPLAVAFALAAVISPTDVVAVSAIASRISVPKRLMRILEGEALLNDASGLVCLRFAVAAALTGGFSFADALGDFLWLSIGGLSIGAAVILSVGWLKSRLSLRYGEHTGSQILISLLLPFAAYLLAEAAGCSGILAAVAGGVAMSYVEQWGGVRPNTRMQRTTVWQTVQFAASGAIFVLLGEQLPQIANGAARVVRETGHHEIAWLAIYVTAIVVAVAVLRFIWVWAMLRFTIARPGHSAPFEPGWRLVTAMSVAGVRGTVTLAGVLSLPLTLANGRHFPERDLAIFLAAGVIVASLVAASLLLPSLFRGLHLPPEPGEEEAEDRARIAASEAALAALARAEREGADAPEDADLLADARARIIADYRQRIDARSKSGTVRDVARRSDEIERKLWLIGSRAEREEIFRLARSLQLSDETARKLVREIDLLEARIRGL